MKFSECYKQTGQLCKFSPNGTYLASTVQNRLVVRSTKSLQVTQVFSCQYAIQAVEWCSDSSLVLCAMFKRSVIQIWSLSQPTWCCKIDEGTAGIIGFSWSPDARHVLTIAEFHVRITVWSLVNKAVSYIRYPKSIESSHAFSPDGRYLALIERRDCKDYISIFSCSAWQLMKHFEVETKDATGVSWSPDSRVICIWESPLDYKVLIYSVDGRCLAVYNAYHWALGVKAVAWSPSSQFLAIGSYDQKVRILNHIIWRSVAEYSHEELLTKSNFVMYKEMEKLWGARGLRLGSTTTTKYEVIVERPVSVATVKPDLTKANPRLGVSFAAFSPNNRYLATRNDNMPTVLWIWSMEELSLAAVLVQVHPIKHIVWNPHQSSVAICTGTNKIYTWSPDDCKAFEIPTQSNFECLSLEWHVDGAILLAVSKDEVCVAFVES